MKTKEEFEGGKADIPHLQVHLFDIDIPGKQTFRESDTLTAGESLTVVDTDCGKLGIGICYDIRFPEMAAVYARRGVQLLVYPGTSSRCIAFIDPPFPLS